jgi:uncharacterized protein (TIGR02001 family)
MHGLEGDWQLGRRERRLVKCGAALAFFLASPAAAQVAATVGVDSDYRLRGYSLTNDHPAISGSVSYDHSSGFYFSLAGLADLRAEPRFLGIIGNVGYARKVGTVVTIDGGVLRYQIRSAESDKPGFEYTEFYGGASVGLVTGRVYYSPHYRTDALPTLYGEVEAGFEPADKWRLSGHVGVLTYLKSSYYYRSGETHRDWRVTLSRRLGRFELHSAISAGGPSSYQGYRLHKKVALTAGASVSF